MSLRALNTAVAGSTEASESRGSTDAEVNRLIDNAVAVSERAVLEVGKTVQEIVTVAQEQVDESSRIASQFGHDSEVANAIAEQTQSMTEFVAWVTQQLTSQRELTASVVRQLDQIVGAGMRINSIAQEAKIVTINARIEAARLGAQGKPFAVIAEQLAELAEGVRAANTMIENLTVTMQSSMPRLATITDELSADSEEFKASYTRALERVVQAQEQLHCQVYDSLHAGERRSSQMLAGSQRILSSLQFQDPMAQSLRKVVDLLGAAGTSPEVEAPPANDAPEQTGSVGPLDNGDVLLF